MATIVPNKSFDPLQAANDLIKAFKGCTNEKMVIGVVTSHDNKQRQEIKSRFQLITGKDLNKELKSELRGNFEDAVLSLFVPTYDYFAGLLIKTLKGSSTDESMMAELLCPHSNRDLALIKDAFNKLAGRNLEEAVTKETTGELKRLWTYQVRGCRIESKQVDANMAVRDAKELFATVEGRFESDNSKFNDLLCTRSFAQLKETFAQYHKITGHLIDDVIKNETKGKLKDGLLAVVNYINDPHIFFADRLQNCFKGLGTKDDTLIRILVSRAEIDLAHISRAYQEKYSKPLADAIKSECRGDYEALLLALL